MELNIDEALRYLGVKSDPDGVLHAQMIPLAAALQRGVRPRSTWVLTDKAALALPGHTAGKMLADCRQCAVLVCTLGAEFDLWVRREQARNMGRAAMLDALGSAYVEAACDAAEAEIRARFPGKHLTDRFSPGYGDLPLALQPALLSVTGAHRIGVTLTDSLLMNPQKSVSAIVGISDTPQPARIRGCAHCHLREHCAYRKAGTTCHV
jgi:hypothetical protein